MRKEYTRTIYFILILLLILLGISLCLMYHAQFISSLFHKHFIKQCGWIILGIVVMMICYLIPSKIWFNYSLGIYLLNVVLLVLVLFMGKSANGAKAWLAIGNFQIQPSEFMKFSYSLFLASFCANRHFYHFREEWKFLLKVFLIFIIPTILVFLEPDTGAIIFFMLITFLLLWKTKISRGWFWIFF